MALAQSFTDNLETCNLEYLEDDGYEVDCASAGYHLKSNLGWYWKDDFESPFGGHWLWQADEGNYNQNFNGDNSSGFTSLPSGFFVDFHYINNSYLGSYYWTSNYCKLVIVSVNNSLSFSSGGYSDCDNFLNAAFAIRCLKD